jgi:hypothetical protein
MRALLRVLFALVVLGALSGCTNTGSMVRYDGCENHPEDPCDIEAERRMDERNWIDSQAHEDYRKSQEEYEEYLWERDQPSVYNGGDLDCEDFGSRSEAQAYLEANPTDSDYLDGDGDGVACEWGI